MDNYGSTALHLALSSGVQTFDHNETVAVLIKGTLLYLEILLEMTLCL